MVCILCGPSYTDDLDTVDPALKLMLAPHVRLVTYDEAIAHPQQIDALMCFCHPRVNAELLDRISSSPSSIKVVSNYGVGVDHIDLQECRRRGIPVGNTPDILSDTTADMAWALLMASAREIVQGDAYARGPQFTAYQNMVLLGSDVAHATIGIIGMGRIGSEVARRATGFKMTILYHNRSRNEKAETELGAQYCSLDDLLRRSDYVVLVCPVTPETRHLINATTLSMMKKTAKLINIARGLVVDTDALLHALQNGIIAGCGLDVTEPEPLPRDHPLLKLTNVVIAPHRGSATVQTRAKMAEMTVHNLLRGLQGEPLLAQCN